MTPMVAISLAGLVIVILLHTAALFIWGTRLTENVKQMKDTMFHLHNDHEKEIALLREHQFRVAPALAELGLAINYLKEELAYIRTTRRTVEMPGQKS